MTAARLPSTAIVVLVSGLSTASGAATKTARPRTAGAAAAPPSQARINANVNRLLGQMTVAEKFGQLEMAGPTSDNNQTLMEQVQAGQVGTVLVKASAVK
jgi:hypothetical protein